MLFFVFQQKLEEHIGSFHNPANPKPLPIPGGRKRRFAKRGTRDALVVLSGAMDPSAVDVAKLPVSSPKITPFSGDPMFPLVDNERKSKKRMIAEVDPLKCDVAVVLAPGTPVMKSLVAGGGNKAKEKAGDGDVVLNEWEGIFREK